MTAVMEVLKQIFAKLANFFDFFDLSYFVSGGIALLALLCLNAELGVLGLPAITEIATVHVVIIVLVTYVLGLQCFALGRLVRRFIVGRSTRSTRPDARLLNLFRAHDLDQDPHLVRYLADPSAQSLKSLFPRLWAELRQDTTLAPSLNLITGYWVRAAIYDGLLTAFFLWMIAVSTALYQKLPGLGTPAVGIGALLLLAMSAVACAREAQRSDLYQIDELVATLRWRRDQGHPHGHPATPPGSTVATATVAVTSPTNTAP